MRILNVWCRYNAHFVPVRYCGRSHCVTGRSLPLDTDYQAGVEGAGASEPPQRLCDVSCCGAPIADTHAAAHELVALSPEQALPVAVVWLKRLKP